MSNTLSLATRLRTMSDAQVHHAMTGREIRTSGIHDLFDLAEAFLERSAVQRALTRLDRTTLAVIGAVGRITGDTAATGGRASVGDVVSHLSEYSDRPWDTAVIARRAEHASALLLLEPRDEGYASYSSIDEHFEDASNGPVPSLEDLAAPLPPAMTDAPSEWTSARSIVSPRNARSRRRRPQQNSSSNWSATRLANWPRAGCPCQTPSAWRARWR